MALIVFSEQAAAVAAAVAAATNSINQQIDEMTACFSSATNLNDSNNEQESIRSLISNNNNISADTDFDSIVSIENKDCEYLKLVCGFKRTLVLPDAFFVYDSPICYCQKCVSGTRGCILKGWVRFKINQFITNTNYPTVQSDCNTDWTTAYYLTRVDKIRAILDHGQPLPIGKQYFDYVV